MLRSTVASPRYGCKSYPVRLGVALAGLLPVLAAGCSGITARGRNAEGVRHFEQARFHEALREFQEATYADPSHPDGYYNQARTYHQLGVTEKRPADLKRAEDLYNQCLERDENCRECYRALAVLLAQQGRRDEAFRLIEGWVDKQPGTADSQIELGRLCEETGDREAAKTHLINALKSDPYNERASNALARLQEEAGELELALRNYQRSLQHNRFQPQVASRVSALQSRIGPPQSITAPDGGTRIVEKESATLK